MATVRRRVSRPALRPRVITFVRKLNRIMPRYEFVISVENRPYLLWQAMLFHYSCLKHQGQAPLIVVHKGDEPLLEGFDSIARSGGRIQTAPNFRDVDHVVYPPRNEPAALQYVECDTDYIMLCEPDMVFLEPLSLEGIELNQSRVSFDRVGYLEADREEYQPALDEVCRRADIDPQALRTHPINGGVPHILPNHLKNQLSQQWLYGIELFAKYSLEAPTAGKSPPAEPGIHWVAMMWAIVLAVHRLKLHPVMTQLCLLNSHGHSPLPPPSPSGPKIIHYCYGDEGFNKRDFTDAHSAMHRVWNVLPDDGSINGAIRGQLREAREFYRL